MTIHFFKSDRLCVAKPIKLKFIFIIISIYFLFSSHPLITEKNELNEEKRFKIGKEN